MLELYEAYATYTEIMDLTENVIRDVASEVLGTTALTWEGASIDLGPSFRRWRLDEAVRHHNPEISVADCRDREALAAHCARLGVHVKKDYGWGKLLLEIFEKTVEGKLVQPTFITHYPVEVSPLARESDTERGITDRFELFVNGKELANGFSELNDPEDQAARFQAQVDAKGRRRRRSHALRRRLHPCAGSRPAAHRRPRHRHRSPGDAAHRQRFNPRRAAVSVHAARRLGLGEDQEADTQRTQRESKKDRKEKVMS
jgi:lysyl-tRNA synthetase class II